MITIVVQADELLADELAAVADAKQISLQEAVCEALERYVSSEQVAAKPRYSFIGIGRSRFSVHARMWLNGAITPLRAASTGVR